MTTNDLVDRLLAEAEAIDGEARLLQSREVDQAAVDDVARRYRRWYAEALEAVDDALRAKFEDAYEGTTWTARIRAFFTDPLAVNAFWAPDNPLGMSKCNYPYEQTFRESLHIQLEALERSRRAVSARSGTAALGDLSALFRRLPEFVATLTNGATDGVRIRIENERDLQVCIEAILRLHYDDVRREEPAPSVAGASTKADFYLPAERIAVEAKYVRESLTRARLGEEIIIDQRKYAARLEYENLFFLVYDPARRLVNPEGVRIDLMGGVDRPVEVLIVH